MGKARVRPTLIGMAAALTVVTVSGCGMASATSAVRPAAYGSSPTAGAQSIGDRLFTYLGNGGYDVQSYDVHFDYVPDRTTMDSSVRIDAVAQQSLSSFSLDSAAQQIKSVSVDDQPADFHGAGEKLIITPHNVLADGKPFRVDIAYVADRSANPPSPVDPSNPLNFNAWYNTEDGFSLFGQPDRAHVFFPMNDYPSDKARVTFRITTPNDRQAVANGTLQSKTTDGDRTTYVYSTRDPISTQVVQAAVGRFTEIDQRGPNGLPLRSFVTDDLRDQAMPQIALLPSQVAWLERQLGSPYPFETYGVLGVKGGYGAALETATLPTFSAQAGLVKPPADTAPTMLHELVHQYFGDSVAVKSWDDMWISEGHASYYTFLYSTEMGIPPAPISRRTSSAPTTSTRTTGRKPARRDT
jgi:aminopeptidase N